MSPEKKLISIAKDFTKFPGGRFLSDGPYSGQRFRDDFLVPSLRSFASVEVDTDGTLGFGSSFLEEAFGGLVRDHRFPKDDLKKRLTITGKNKTIIELIWLYINNA